MNEETELSPELELKLKLEAEKEREAEEYLENLEKSDKTPWIIRATLYMAKVLIFSALVYFCVGTAIIDGESMLPTFENGQKLLLNKTAFILSDGDYGDFVVFRPVEGYPDVFVKRLIGKPGDTIEVKDNTILRNGEKIVEPYIKEPMQTEDMRVLTLEEDQYFFMGDNRNHSTDSRNVNIRAVDKSLILGELITFSK